MEARRGLADAQGQAATAGREAEASARRSGELRSRVDELGRAVRSAARR